MTRDARESDAPGSRSGKPADTLQVQYSACLWDLLPSGPAVLPAIPREFPGFVVRRNGIILAAAGCCCEPDQTLSATLPLLTPAADWREQCVLAGALFSEMAQFARQRRLRMIHCLVPSEDAGRAAMSGCVSSAALLQHCGLAWMATIVRQTRLLARPESGVTAQEQLHGIPLTSSRTQPDVVLAQARTPGTVHELLEVVLQNSLDLPAAIRPSAAGLLAMWKQRRAEVMVVSQNERPIAIAALAGPDCGEDATLEYIGVHPEHRLAGIGRILLRLAEKAVLEFAASSSRTGECRLNAYADASNRPAMRLYAASGYVEAEKLQLYCLPLFTEVADHRGG